MGWSSDDTAVDDATLKASAIRDVERALVAIKGDHWSSANNFLAEARASVFSMLRRTHDPR
jgi:hypothetical protein